LCLNPSTALLEKEDVIGLAREMVAGFQSVSPVPDAELSLLHPLVCARLAQSVTMGAYSYSKNPQNEYLLVTAQPGWKLLKLLMSFTAEQIERFNGGAA
jgi:Ser/Thr protein kinase RdoA (MazF antagonist)